MGWVRAAVVTPCVMANQNTISRTRDAKYVCSDCRKRWALELKAWDHDIEPKGAEKTQGNITLTKANAADVVTIEAGKVVQTPLIDGVVYKVRVLAETVIDAGQLTGKVLVEAFKRWCSF